MALLGTQATNGQSPPTRACSTTATDRSPSDPQIILAPAPAPRITTSYVSIGPSNRRTTDLGLRRLPGLSVSTVYGTASVAAWQPTPSQGTLEGTRNGSAYSPTDDAD